MNYIKKAVTTLGGVFLAALLIAALAPKATHGLVAALVQIVPGSTTHVGQNESQLVALACESAVAYCYEETPAGGSTCCSATAYVVPSGYTLVVTDFSWLSNGLPANQFACDNLIGYSGGVGNQYLSSQSCALANGSGSATHDSHFTTGLRFASGSFLSDYLSDNFLSSSSIQGYLVPN
jgi:hypothetical protein